MDLAIANLNNHLKLVVRLQMEGEQMANPDVGRYLGKGWDSVDLLVVDSGNSVVNHFEIVVADIDLAFLVDKDMAELLAVDMDIEY